MLFAFLADALFLAHVAFIAFVGLGGFLAWRWRKVAWVHLPAAAWAVLVQFVSWMCPLTEWENTFRQQAGDAGYAGGFIEHYIVPIVYPANLTPHVQLSLASLVVVLNAAAYAVYWRKWRKKRG